MKNLFLSLLTLFILPFANADTSVWKAEKDKATVYLGGTIHLLRASDYPLPVEFEQAFNASQVITFETDINQMNSPKMISELLYRLSYHDDRTIKSELSAETYAKLEKYAASSGISLEYMKKAKPGMMMSALMVSELKKIGANQEGIDLFFLKKANKQGKTTDFLETPSQQLSFLAQLGVGNEEAFYQNMLREFSQTQQIFTSMVNYWRQGNAEQLDSEINAVMKKESPHMYQTLLVDRNNNWMPLIEDYFQTSDVEFILVGAAHLIGKDGIIERLKQKGYRVTKL